MIHGRLTTYVGDVNAYLRAAARRTHASAFLVSNANWQEFVNTDYQDVAVYTSLGDLAVDNFCALLDMSDTIEYCPPPDHRWSDRRSINALDPFDSIRGLTEYLLQRHIDRKDLRNLDQVHQPPELLPLVDSRRTAAPQLWTAGCSITAGIGVDAAQSWSHVLAQQLNLQVSVLAELGSSNTWQADQILRSDIRWRDTVVWGITGLYRQWIVQHGEMRHLNMHSHVEDHSLESDWPLRALASDTTLYASINCMKSVANFCEKVGARLVIFNANFSDAYITSLRQIPHFHYYQHPIRIGKDRQIRQHWLDLGTDDSHPGPIQHLAFANFCNSLLKPQTDSVLSVVT